MMQTPAPAVQVSPLQSTFCGGTTHYSLAQHTDVLVQWAEQTTSALKHELQGALPVFCYAGMSGCAHATALSMVWLNRVGADFGMIYVRKESERHHNFMDEEVSLARAKTKRAVLVFVDDMISQGVTQGRVLNRAAKVAIGHGRTLDTKTCVNCLMMGTRRDDLGKIVRHDMLQPPTWTLQQAVAEAIALEVDVAAVPPPILPPAPMCEAFIPKTGRPFTTEQLSAIFSNVRVS